MDSVQIESGISKDLITKQLLHVLLTTGKPPVSVYAFCNSIGIEEAEFYNLFSSFEAVEGEVWKQMHNKALSGLIQTPQYEAFTVKEKWLGYLYALTESLKANRSYIKWSVSNYKPLVRKNAIDALKSAFETYASQLVAEGIQSGELINRPFLTERYANTMWIQVWFIIKFWSEDSSVNFERTDAAIEKSVEAAMDLLGKNAIDSIFDLGKFLLEKKA